MKYRSSSIVPLSLSSRRFPLLSWLESSFPLRIHPNVNIQPSYLRRTSLGAQTAKLLLTTQETQVRALGRGDPLEKKMAPHSSTLAWRIPWTEEPGRLQSVELQRSDTTEQLHFLSSFLSKCQRSTSTCLLCISI